MRDPTRREVPGAGYGRGAWSYGTCVGWPTPPSAVPVDPRQSLQFMRLCTAPKARAPERSSGCPAHATPPGGVPARSEWRRRQCHCRDPGPGRRVRLQRPRACHPLATGFPPSVGNRRAGRRIGRCRNHTIVPALDVTHVTSCHPPRVVGGVATASRSRSVSLPRRTAHPEAASGAAHRTHQRAPPTPRQHLTGEEPTGRCFHVVVSGLRSGNSASASSDGSLREQPLSPETREQYVAQWAAVQEQFVHLTVEGRHRGGRAAGAPGRGARLPRRRAVRGAVGRPLRPPRLLRPGLPQHAHSSPRPERHRGDAGGYRRSPRPLRGTGHRRAGRPGPAPTRSYSRRANGTSWPCASSRPSAPSSTAHARPWARPTPSSTKSPPTSRTP